MKLLRRVLTLLIVAAYVGATVFQVAPAMAISAEPGSAAATTGMMHEPAMPADNMPCKGMVPNCVTDIGCVFLVSLPTPDLNLFTTATWSSVVYDHPSDALRGRTIKPPLGPPISAA